MKSVAEAPKNQTLVEKVAIVAVVALLSFNGFVAFGMISRLKLHTERVGKSSALLLLIDALESTIRSAETGQRGFIITGQDMYLEPYTEAIKNVDSLLSQISTRIGDDQAKERQFEALKPLIHQKMGELDSTIAVRREQGFEQAQELVKSHIGLQTMDSIKKALDQLRQAETIHMADHEVTAATTYWSALLTSLSSTISSLLLIVAVLYVVQRNRQRAEQSAETIQREHLRLQASLDRNTLLEIENRQMNQYMRTIVEQVQDYAIFGMDEQCRATTWNEGVKHVLGFEEHEFVGQDVRKLIFTPEAIEVGIPAAEFETAIREGRASDDRWMMRKCGKRFWASGITSAVKDENGNLTGFSKVMRDLTKRKRDEDEMAELAAQLGEIDRRKNEFLATLAHELRNPLAPIQSAVELMAMSGLSVENEELRETIARQVDQVTHLIDDLLDVSRIGHGKLTLHKSVVDLRSIIESAVEASNTSVRSKGQHLEVEISTEKALVNGDPTRLTQVVCNLLNNASRYSDAGCHISVTLSIEPDEGEYGSAQIIVKDDGIGISADRLDEIFQMFSQIHDPLGRGNAGLGIGLTLVKRLVELHGGRVTAESDGLGHGSVFTVQIPLAAPDAIVVPAQISDKPQQTPILARSFRVLVVEDMRALRVIMSRLLERLGHEVKVAESGLEALESLSTFQAEIIFSDIAMPGMTGYDLARKLRTQARFAETYLVAMTGYGQLSDRTLSRESGFDEHMVKPVDVNVLRELFDRLTRAHHPST